MPKRYKRIPVSEDTYNELQALKSYMSMTSNRKLDYDEVIMMLISMYKTADPSFKATLELVRLGKRS